MTLVEFIVATALHADTRCLRLMRAIASDGAQNAAAALTGAGRHAELLSDLSRTDGLWRLVQPLLSYASYRRQRSRMLFIEAATCAVEPQLALISSMLRRTKAISAKDQAALNRLRSRLLKHRAFDGVDARALTTAFVADSAAWRELLQGPGATIALANRLIVERGFYRTYRRGRRWSQRLILNTEPNVGQVGQLRTWVKCFAVQLSLFDGSLSHSSGQRSLQVRRLVDDLAELEQLLKLLAGADIAHLREKHAWRLRRLLRRRVGLLHNNCTALAQDVFAARRSEFCAAIEVEVARLDLVGV